MDQFVHQLNTADMFYDNQAVEAERCFPCVREAVCSYYGDTIVAEIIDGSAIPQQQQNILYGTHFL